MSPFRTLLALRMMKVVVITGAVRRAKLQSNRHHQHNITRTFSKAGCPSCRPTNSVRALKGESITPRTCSPQAHQGYWPLKAPSYIGEGCQASQPPNASTLALSTNWPTKIIWISINQSTFVKRHKSRVNRRHVNLTYCLWTKDFLLLFKKK